MYRLRHCSAGIANAATLTFRPVPRSDVCIRSHISNSIRNVRVCAHRVAQGTSEGCGSVLAQDCCKSRVHCRRGAGCGASFSFDLASIKQDAFTVAMGAVGISNFHCGRALCSCRKGSIAFVASLIIAFAFYILLFSRPESLKSPSLISTFPFTPRKSESSSHSL